MANPGCRFRQDLPIKHFLGGVVLRYDNIYKFSSMLRADLKSRSSASHAGNGFAERKITLALEKDGGP